MRGLLKNLGSVTAVALLLVPAAFAQTTGRIVGKVVGPDGAALPGVTVSADSVKAIGERATITDAQGQFRIVNLPPGEYTVSAGLDGFNTVEQAGLTVGIDRTVTLELQLSSAIEDTITVTGEGPVVDVTSAEQGLSVGSDTFESLPTQRNFYAVAQLAAGTGTDTYGTTVGGSTSAENQYVIEGLNTTGVEFGTEGKTLNFDFIEEVEIKTGGLSAEYGRLTGGVINAVTKSGGNEFTGDLFGYYEGGPLRWDNSTAGNRPNTTTQVIDVDQRLDYGFDLGGYVVQDKVWFFAAYNSVDNENLTTVIRPLVGAGTPAPGTEIPSTVERDLYAGKLTWSLSSNHVVTGSFFGDPSEASGPQFVIRGPEVTWNGTNDTGAIDGIVRYDGVFGGNWVVEASFGRHEEESKINGPGKDTPQLLDFTQNPSTRENGFGFHQDTEFTREVFKANATAFAGRHEIKFGGDIEDLSAVNQSWNGGGGQRIYRFAAADGTIYYRHRFFIDDTDPNFSRTDASTWNLLAPTLEEPETTNTSAYLQDSWRLGDNVTVNLGLRWERQELLDRFGATAIDIDDNWAPRVGLIWDVLGSGRSKLFANYGRYYQAVPMDINIRAFGGQVTCFCYNFDQDPNNLNPLNFGGVTDDPRLPGSRLLGGATPVDPDLEGQYIDEYLLGFEYEIMPDLALGIQGTYREIGQAIEDFLIVSLGNYFIANPGSGLGTDLTFFDYSTAPAPPVSREYSGLNLTARKRFSDNWQMIASYVWSELEGNYDGAFQVATGQLDPNINSAYDYGDFLVNAQGPLSLEQQHVFKVDGSYLFTDGVLDGLSLGLGLNWSSGFPLNAYGYNAYYANWENYLAPRGSVGTGPSFYEADLHVGYPIRFGDTSLNIVVDVFNLLDRQSVTRVDERYNLIQDGACAGVPTNLCNADPNFGSIANVPGTTDPVGSLGDPRATATNPDYLDKGFNFTPPRSVRLGLRFSF